MKFIGTSTAPILAIANLIAANPCEFLAITAVSYTHLTLPTILLV